jgi:hypothetical protein
MQGDSYQCFQRQDPWSMISAHVPKRISPFSNLTPLALQTLSWQAARLLGETSAYARKLRDIGA